MAADLAAGGVVEVSDPSSDAFGQIWQGRERILLCFCGSPGKYVGHVTLTKPLAEVTDEELVDLIRWGTENAVEPSLLPPVDEDHLLRLRK